MRSIECLFILVLAAILSCTNPSYRSDGQSASSPPAAYHSPPPPPPADSGPFQASYNPSLSRPEVRIVNEAERTITVTLEGPTDRTVVLPAGQQQTVSVDPGSYTYRGEAPGVLPASGVTTFQRQYEYTWTFWIRTVTGPR